MTRFLTGRGSGAHHMPQGFFDTRATFSSTVVVAAQLQLFLRHDGGLSAAQPSQTQTSVRLATQAPNSAIDSATGRCSQEVWRIVGLMPKTSSDSTPGVSANIFLGIQDSFTTQGLQA